jgi:hypothetical protein
MSELRSDSRDEQRNGVVPDAPTKREVYACPEGENWSMSVSWSYWRKGHGATIEPDGSYWEVTVTPRGILGWCSWAETFERAVRIAEREVDLLVGDASERPATEQAASVDGAEREGGL